MIGADTKRRRLGSKTWPKTEMFHLYDEHVLANGSLRATLLQSEVAWLSDIDVDTPAEASPQLSHGGPRAANPKLGPATA